MADNVTLNSGSGGAVAATDDVAGVHYQRVKLVDGTLDSTAAIPGDATNGLDVDVTRVGGNVTVVQGTAANLNVTEASAAAIKTSVELIDDAIVADDAAFTPATTKVLMAGAEFDDAAPDSVDEGDGGALRMSANRNLYVRIRDNAGNERGLNIDANGELQISGTRNALPITDNAGSLTVDNAGTFAVQATIAAGATAIAKAEDVASADADVGVPAMAVRKATPANTSGTDGDYEMLQMSAGRLWASATIDAALPAGTNAIGKLAANSGVDIGDVDVTSIVMPTGASAAQVQGTVAHDGVDAQNPIGMGARAIAHGTNPTAVAAADRTVVYANRAGIPFFIGGHPNIVTIEAAYTAAQTDVAIVTVSSGLKIVVTQIQAMCDNANTVDVGLRVGFAAANTPTTTGVVLTHPGIAAGSGVSRGDGSSVLGVGADGEDLRITSEVPTTGSLRILVSYFTIES